MKLQKARRAQAKIRLCLQGPSGSGKTYSALLVAYGLCGDWGKIAVIDTEHGSATLYSHLGEYNVLSLSSPFSPERYIDALKVCESAGIEVVIIDSISFEWEYLIDFHAGLSGNSFTNWSKVTPRHNKFIQAILQSPCHVIATARTKQDYVLNDKNGRMVPEKVQLKVIQRDGIEYEFTIVFDLDMKNHAIASKDRTCLFHGKPEQKLGPNTGTLILQWCMGESDEVKPSGDDVIRQQVGLCTSLGELTTLYNHCTPEQKETLLTAFQRQKKLIKESYLLTNQLLNQTINKNGSSTSIQQD
jgi:hypothetical protein